MQRSTRMARGSAGLSRSGRTRRIVSLVLTAVMASAVVVAVQAPIEAKALDGSQFDAGNIISDAKFYDSNAMSQAEIQAFLESREPGACGPASCLKSFSTVTTNYPKVTSDSTGNVRCSAYDGGSRETAAAIIYKVQRACGISAKVILVTLQKERGLVTKTSPSADDYTIAMGYACPDHGAVCDTRYYGFFNQVYWGALQLNTYRASKFGMQPGQHSIAYSPAASCGSKSVNVVNYATAALYNYTPYTPNAASLANLRGEVLTGDKFCGAYGNRNFWVFYNDYFGSPTGGPSGQLQAVTAANNSVVVSGWAVDSDAPQSQIPVRVSGAGWTTTITANAGNPASLGAFPASGSNHGFSATVTAAVGQQQICVTAVGSRSEASLGCTTVTVPTQVSAISRISGADRYSTALEISKANFPTPGVAVAYVVSGENFPDALSAVPAAAQQKAPMLLSMQSSVPANVLAELTRLKPAKIVVVGGLSVLSDAAVAQLGAIAPVQRVDGIDRYQTSLRVGDILGGLRSGTAYLATGSSFPDAISAASAAGFQKAPLILVDGTGTAVPSEVAAALAQWGVTKVVLVGGPAVMSPAFEAAVRALPNVTVTRLSGDDRYQTSLQINKTIFGSVAGGYVATGVDYPDGLTGGSIAGAKGQPLYLSANGCLPSGVITQLVATRSTGLTLLGGPSALGDGVARLLPC
jgi:putative cell wall-binding protein